jgi:hypothetical protein
VYDLTHSTLAVGLLGLCELLPVLVLPIIGGAAVSYRKPLDPAGIGFLWNQVFADHASRMVGGIDTRVAAVVIGDLRERELRQ